MGEKRWKGGESLLNDCLWPNDEDVWSSNDYLARFEKTSKQQNTCIWRIRTHTQYAFSYWYWALPLPLIYP